MSLSYFAENNSGTEQLWVTDDTAAGTRMVKAFAGSGIAEMTMIGARVYFTVDDGVHGQELWTSDGTVAGTMLVSDIYPGITASNAYELTNVNGTLFLAAQDPTHGYELWKSDGTAAGTTLIKDIVPGGGSSVGGPLVKVGSTVFFQGTDGINGFELFKSDGTAAGTMMVKDIVPGAGSSSPEEPTNVDGTLFFFADDGTHGFELWTSDGTAAGTGMVQDINPGAGSSVNTAQPPVAINGTAFFQGTDGTNGAELWKSDGTAAGTVMVKDIDAGAGASTPLLLTRVNDTLFFFADDAIHGLELWKSDGTAGGTVMVKDINPGAGGSIAGPSGNMVDINGTLFFAASDGANGQELWKSDGTAAGTVMVKDIVAGTGSSGPLQLTNVNGILELYAQDGMDEGLFRSDGTAAGTIEIATHVDINVPIACSSQPVVNDLSDNAHSDILWRNADGTLVAWLMDGGAIQSSGIRAADGVVAIPGSSWHIAGISDFNGDGKADVLWRDADGTLIDWSMSGNVITSNGVLNTGGGVVKPDTSWSVVGTGDFDGDTHSDILWRNANGTVAEWDMKGSTIVSSGAVTFNGAAVNVGASWSVAGVGDFNGDDRRDVLWRNTDGTLVEWNMDGSTIASSGILFGGAVKPDASWNIAGVGDFNGDGRSDVLWRNANGSLAEWLMNGSIGPSSGSVTFGGAQVAPDAGWHVVEIGDFNGDSQSDILWRNDNGALAEWLMNGTRIVASVTPSLGGTAVSPEATWSTQAKPTNFG